MAEAGKSTLGSKDTGRFTNEQCSNRGGKGDLQSGNRQCHAVDQGWDGNAFLARYTGFRAQMNGPPQRIRRKE